VVHKPKTHECYEYSISCELREQANLRGDYLAKSIHADFLFRFHLIERQAEHLACRSISYQGPGRGEAGCEVVMPVGWPRQQWTDGGGSGRRRTEEGQTELYLCLNDHINPVNGPFRSLLRPPTEIRYLVC
jgi:hypothetical protein